MSLAPSSTLCRRMVLRSTGRPRLRDRPWSVRPLAQRELESAARVSRAPRNSVDEPDRRTLDAPRLARAVELASQKPLEHAEGDRQPRDREGRAGEALERGLRPPPGRRQRRDPPGDRRLVGLEGLSL